MKKLEKKMYELTEKLPSGRTQLQLSDNTELEIEGSRRIIEYDENYILIKLEKNILKIIGTDLKTNCYSSGYVNVYGKIQSLEFIEE